MVVPEYFVMLCLSITAVVPAVNRVLSFSECILVYIVSTSDYMTILLELRMFIRVVTLTMCWFEIGLPSATAGQSPTNTASNWANRRLVSHGSIDGYWMLDRCHRLTLCGLMYQHRMFWKKINFITALKHNNMFINAESRAVKLSS